MSQLEAKINQLFADEDEGVEIRIVKKQAHNFGGNTKSANAYSHAAEKARLSALVVEAARAYIETSPKTKTLFRRRGLLLAKAIDDLDRVCGARDFIFNREAVD